MLHRSFYALGMFQRKVVPIRCSEGLLRQVRLHLYSLDAGAVCAASPDVPKLWVCAERPSIAIEEFMARAEGFVYCDDW